MLPATLLALLLAPNAAPTPHPHPVPTIDVFVQDGKLVAKVNAPGHANETILVANNPISDGSLPTVQGEGKPKPKLRAKEHWKAPSGKQLSISCDGEVKAHGYSFNIEGISTFLFPEGFKITFNQSSSLCGKIDVMSGRTRVRVVIGDDGVQTTTHNDRHRVDRKLKDGTVYFPGTPENSTKIQWVTVDGSLDDIKPGKAVKTNGPKPKGKRIPYLAWELNKAMLRSLIGIEAADELLGSDGDAAAIEEGGLVKIVVDNGSG